MKLNKIQGILIATALLAAPAAQAQQQPAQQQQQQPSGSAPSSSPDTSVAPLPPLPPDQPGGSSGNNNNPAPAGRGLFVGSTAQDQNGAVLQPDNHVLSSPESIGLGNPAGTHQTFDPMLRASESVTSGLLTNQLQSATLIGGGLTFDQQWERYRLTLLYSGAETLYAPNSSLNTSYHNGTISQDYTSGRWVVRLRDDVVVAPGASFSGLYSGSTGIAGVTVPIPTTAPVLNNNETIQTGLARSLSNSSIGEVDFSISPRSSLTATATYGLIDFLVPGYLNSYRAGGGAGYNYSLDAKDSISVLYNYVAIGFRSQSNLLVTHIVQVAYGRKITGRLAFQLSAGPELLQLSNYGPNTGQNWSWVLSSGLTYLLSPTTNVQGTFLHDVTAGSGVFLGARSDIFTVGFNRQLARSWWASLNGGYARNANLAPAAGVSNLYNNYFGGVGVTHRLSHTFDLALNYGLQKQTGTPGACTVATCGLPAGVYNVGTVTLNWHPLADRYIRSAY